MNKNNLKLVLRLLRRNKLYTILNILGLSIGMASAILIFLWVNFQISFDRYHKNGDSIYRVVQDQFYTNGEVFHVSVTPTGLIKVLKDNIANIAHSTRYNNQQFLLSIKENKNMEEVHLVDADFFKIFSNPLISGAPATVFKNTHFMVISEKMASKYFGKNNPIGEIITLEGKYAFTVTGVIKDSPKNSDIWYNFLIPFEFYKEMRVNVEDFGNNWISSYVQLTPGTSFQTINQAIEKFKKKNYPKVTAVFYLQPMKSIHLYWLGGGGPIKNVKLFSLIAALIIFIAAINFTNLSTAMARKRHKEIGVKKVFGANKKFLLRQFYMETFLLSFLSLFVALILTETLLPWYNALLETNLKLTYVDWKLFCGILGIVFITGILAGTYPAIFLSSLKPALILKGANKQKKSVLRETLVVLQFGLAIVLIINTIIIKKQRDFMQKEAVGIQKENIIYLPIRGALYQKFELFKSEMSHDPSVKSICLSSHLPSAVWSNGGDYKWSNKPPQVDPLVSYMFVDFDYAKTFGLKMHDGEFYSDKKYNDTSHIVINKVFADIIGLKPIIGQIIECGGRKLSIIGVTENFHFKPLHTKIEPLAMYCFPQELSYIFLKISSNNMQKAIRKIDEVHNKINGAYPFEYHFLDETYDQLYKGEERQGKIFGFFSFLAIFISCLGLFGLSSFMIAQHTREIGIRKANGAMVTGLMLFFIKYYVKWVLVSFLIAAPVSYYFLNMWLKNFAYKTSLSWWIFAIAGLIAFLIALVTVSWQSWRAANKNPMETLRYE